MLRAALLALCLANPAAAQGWGDLDSLLASSLAPSGGEVVGAYFLPDSADPEAATEALGVVYEVIEGAAGNTTIAVGHFVKLGTGFTYAGPVAEVFGQEPREAAFLPDRIEVTTTMPREEDPRCCPTGASRWVIDRATLTATEVPLN